jgi:phosphoribosylamine---glycine ligase
MIVMNVFVIGSGGREHAICSSFAKSPRVTRLFCANGNGGIASVAECVPIAPDDILNLAAFASDNNIDLTFVGGETSLALGIVDEFESRGLPIIGPNREAAQLESSKSFAKDFMARHAVPTATFVTAHSPGFAILELESGDFGDENTPVVVKADGLAAGKGVVVAANRAEAISAINEMAARVGTEAADKIVLEECLVGKEVSLLMFADGGDFALMPATRDHKRIGEGDTGPNTGGMGAITDSSLLSSRDLAEIINTIVSPTLQGCISEGFRFRGILFLGLMITAEGPKLLEYNVRFGDPETQAILVRLETDLVDICEAMLAGGSSASRTFSEIKWKPGTSACVVLAASGYPSKPRTGDVIHGLDRAKDIANVEVFHAGTALAALYGAASSYVTTGGRVLGVTANANDLATALAIAYSAVGEVSFDGMQFRRDIGRAA